MGPRLTHSVAIDGIYKKGRTRGIHSPEDDSTGLMGSWSPKVTLEFHL